MANLNLSEFTEKLFVADADHTFIWDTAASISKRVSRNSWLNSGELTSSAPVTISQTWGTTGIYTAAKVNVTETATANAASLLLDLQVGGVSKFKVNKAGAATMVSATIGTAYISSIGFSASYIPVSGGFDTTGGLVIGNYSASLSYLNGLALRSNYFVGWSNTTSGIDTPDTILLRDGAPNTLALRNGTAAQTFRVYNTYTDASNYERGFMRWGSSILQIGAEGAGSGANRTVGIYVSGSNYFGIGGIQSPIWNVVAAGHLQSGTDNTYDIGASGANRPRNVYVGNNVIVGNTVSTGICDVTAIRLAANGSGCVIRQDSNGIIRLSNNNETDFTRLQFGGATNAAPAIARDGAGIKFTGAAAGSTAWIKVPPVAVSALPLAATAGAGARAFVNDALAPTFGSAVTGGGAVLVPVYSDGSAWNVG